MLLSRLKFFFPFLCLLLLFKDILLLLLNYYSLGIFAILLKFDPLKENLLLNLLPLLHQVLLLPLAVLTKLLSQFSRLFELFGLSIEGILLVLERRLAKLIMKGAVILIVQCTVMLVIKGIVMLVSQVLINLSIYSKPICNPLCGFPLGLLSLQTSIRFFLSLLFRLLSLLGQ